MFSSGKFSIKPSLLIWIPVESFLRFCVEVLSFSRLKLDKSLRQISEDFSTIDININNVHPPIPTPTRMSQFRLWLNVLRLRLCRSPRLARDRKSGGNDKNFIFKKNFITFRSLARCIINSFYFIGFLLFIDGPWIEAKKNDERVRMGWSNRRKSDENSWNFQFWIRQKNKATTIDKCLSINQKRNSFRNENISQAGGGRRIIEKFDGKRAEKFNKIDSQLSLYSHEFPFRLKRWKMCKRNLHRRWRSHVEVITGRKLCKMFVREAKSNRCTSWWPRGWTKTKVGKILCEEFSSFSLSKM